MADLTVTVPDDTMPRLADACEARFDRGDEETDDELIQRGVRTLIHKLVVSEETRAARREVARKGTGINITPPANDNAKGPPE